MCPFLLGKEMGKRKVVPKFNSPWQSRHHTTRIVAPIGDTGNVKGTATWGDNKRTVKPSIPPAEISGPAMEGRASLPAEVVFQT
jgi:hypothetical protein